MKLIKMLPLLLLIFFSCEMKNQDKSLQAGKKEKKLKEGIHQEYYPDGKLKTELNLVQGKRQGKCRNYYNNGKLWNDIEYVDNEKHGKAITYFENGNLCLVSTYAEGKLDGIQKKYFANGKLQAEILYKNGQPAIGLKEYLKDGSLKKKYPKLIIEPVNKLLKEDTYYLKVYFEGEPANAEYYIGDLEEGKYIGVYMPKLVKKGKVGIVEYNLPPGSYVMEKLNLVGKLTTLNGNPYLVEKKYNLAAENPRF